MDLTPQKEISMKAAQTLKQMNFVKDAAQNLKMNQTNQICALLVNVS